MSLNKLINWIEERYALKEFAKPYLNKPVSAHEMSFQFCWGGITFLLIIIQVITGIFLAYYYRPNVAEAYQSIRFITDEVYLGWLVRGLHHHSSNLLVITVFIHMLIVFFRGAYKNPRELNWVSGALLLLLILAFAFSGYLLIWDQLGYWATRVGTGVAGEVPLVGEYLLLFIQGGYGVKQPTLSRFYATHILVLPAILGLILALHFAMVRRRGISEPL